MRCELCGPPFADRRERRQELPLIQKTDLVELDSGLIVPEHAARERQKPTCVDLFCGCGGFSLGFIEAGFQVVAAADYDFQAMVTYLVNLGAYPVNIHYVTPGDRERAVKLGEKRLIHKSRPAHRGMTGRSRAWTVTTSGCNRPPEYDPGVGHFWFGDLRSVRGRDILDAIGLQPGELDCVIGAPPCQGFTRANRYRHAGDPRNNLVFTFARLVCEIRPKTFVMENVPDMIHMSTPEGVPVVDALCRVFADGGFGTYEGIRRQLIGHEKRRAVVNAEGEKKQRKTTNRDSCLSQGNLF